MVLVDSARLRVNQHPQNPKEFCQSLLLITLTPASFSYFGTAKIQIKQLINTNQNKITINVKQTTKPDLKMGLLSLEKNKL